MQDSEAKKKWQKENMFLLGLKLHRKNDADILAFLQEMGVDKQKVVKQAVREYMERHPKPFVQNDEAQTSE